MEKTIVKIGQKEFSITTPLKFKQLMRFEPAFVRFAGQLVTSENFDALAECLIHVINDEYPDFKLKDLQELRTTPTELLEAMDVLGYASGIFKKKGDAPAEGSAAADQHSGEQLKA